MAETRRNLGGGRRSGELNKTKDFKNLDYYYKSLAGRKAGV